jgi:hypothetical protein
MVLSFDDVARLALDAGFRVDDDSAATAVAIAKAESGFNAGIYGDAAYGGSIGLWQINLPAHPQYAAHQLQDPVTNARAAYVTSKGGTNFNPWCTYKPSACGGVGNNAYARYLDEARAAVARVAGVGPLARVWQKPAGKVAIVAAGGVVALTAAFYIAYGRLPTRRDLGI